MRIIRFSSVSYQGSEEGLGPGGAKTGSCHEVLEALAAAPQMRCDVRAVLNDGPHMVPRGSNTRIFSGLWFQKPYP